MDVGTETSEMNVSIPSDTEENWIDGDAYGHIIHGDEWDELSSISVSEEECHFELSGSSDEEYDWVEQTDASRIHVNYSSKVNSSEL